MLSAEPKEYSSLPLTVGIAGAIVVSAFAGWLALKGNAVSGDGDQPAASPVAAIADPEPVGAAPVDIDAELRKARLAADADLLVSPAEQNALYFYGRVLAADPQNPVAKAERDALLATLSLRVDDHLAAREFDAAYELAVEASRHSPEHPLVGEMHGALNDYVAAIAAEASRLATNGRDDDAVAALAALERLPGLGDEYVASARQAVVDIQQARLAAEQQSREAAQRVAEQAELGTAQKVRDAIAAGNFIAPEGESARDHLARLDAGSEHKAELVSAFRAALLASIETLLEAGELADAEAQLVAVRELGVEDEALAALSADYEARLVEREKSQVLPLTEFIQLSAAPARYPPTARQADTTGWVEVAFTVTSAGRTADIEILRAEPGEVFNSAVIAAVETWTFVPRQFRGRPIDQRTAARLVFNLE